MSTLSSAISKVRHEPRARSEGSERVRHRFDPCVAEPSETIPDECGRYKLKYGDYARHIETCPKPSCREVYQNHLDVLRAFGIPRKDAAAKRS